MPRLHQHGCRRRNGFLATEVFHLWHPENSRAGEAGKRERVVQRMQGSGTAPIVTVLNE
ncbi:MAG TPA: hypothetical protein VGA59_10810 [Ramlibacter sp.]